VNRSRNPAFRLFQICMWATSPAQPTKILMRKKLPSGRWHLHRNSYVSSSFASTTHPSPLRSGHFLRQTRRDEAHPHKMRNRQLSHVRGQGDLRSVRPRHIDGYSPRPVVTFNMPCRVRQGATIFIFRLWRTGVKLRPLLISCRAAGLS
jgi:hypothetical protein